jgi:primosomal protein N' (replication factor Y)
MPLTAQVALFSQAIDKPLTYLIPESLEASVKAGCAVSVPLQSRLTSGVVLSLSDAQSPISNPSTSSGHSLKSLIAVLDETPVLNAERLELAQWIAAEYCAPLGRCCALMVPPGFTPKSSFVYSLAEDKTSAPSMANSMFATVRVRIITALQMRGAITEKKLKVLLKDAKDWQSELKKLLVEGVVIKSSTLQPPIAQPRKTTLAQLLISEATLDIVQTNLREDAKKQPRRAQAIYRRLAVLDYLHAHNGIAWADWIFAETGSNRTDLQWLAEQNYVLLGDAERWRDPLADIDYVVKTAPPLTEDQDNAWTTIKKTLAIGNWQSPNSQLPIANSQFLLRGVTGSGKTEIYMRAVDAVLQRGAGAIVLVPEISLTPQTARRFLERFPGKVALIHSKLKPGERFDTWRRIRSGELPVVIGARSALFAPLPRIGLIVLDEEHDPSYKQNQAPYYDARRVAVRYAQQTGATLIFGSATPSLEAMEMASDERRATNDTHSLFATRHSTFLELPNRVRGHVNRIADQQARLGLHASHIPETQAVAYQPLPDVQLIDMRAELRGGNMGMFSGALRNALAETLQRGEQAILFLNRRGSASCVVCRDCGHALRCPNDDVPLTLHQVTSDERRMTNKHSAFDIQGLALLKCHQCNHTENVPTVCPACRSPRIRFIGIGTQKVEQTIAEQFPKARVVRWDKDASQSASADQMLQRFVNRQADVLIGTQMIAKGLDLPLVTLVGVILADVGLFLPDFRASERVFNLLEQVAGRAGRGLLPGKVFVQTYNPDAPPIQFASKHNVKGFVKYELAQRQQLQLPPFTRLVRFEVMHESNDEARLQAETLARQLRPRVPQRADVIGPAQAYFARRNKKYRWQILVRTLSPAALLKNLDVPRGVVVDVDPVSVL